MSTIRIPLNSRKYPGLYAVIDECDFDAVKQLTWYPLKSRRGWYVQGAIPRELRERFGGKKTIMLHQFILVCPPGTLPDHIDGDGLNNSRTNLRVATRVQNMANAVRRKPSKSGYTGVQRMNRTDLKRPWQARIFEGRKPICLGYFATPEEAARAYDTAAMERHGEFARLNFPVQSGAKKHHQDAPIRTDVRPGKLFREDWQSRTRFKVDPPGTPGKDDKRWTASALTPGHLPRTAVAYGNSPTMALKALLDVMAADPPIQRTDLPQPEEIMGILADDDPVGLLSSTLRCLSRNTDGA